MDTRKREIFESMPPWKAVASLALPSILSQLVTLIYNLADTFYIGQIGNPDMVAAVSVAFAAFMFLVAIANLFGIGGGSLISRMLGEKRPDEAKHVAAFSFFGTLLFTVVYSILLWLFLDPILRLLGASSATIGFGRDYLLWTTVIGGVPTTLGIVLGHLLRSEGYARQSSVGIALGGILNIILDPIFIFVLDMGVAGAAMATMLANGVSLIYYLILMGVLRKRSVLSVNPADIRLNRELTKNVFSVGMPAAAAALLAILANAALFKVLSSYEDLPVAAMGVVKKIDTIPLNVSMGLSQGVLPLVAYNYAAKQYDRMERISRFARLAGAVFALLCVLLFELFAPELVRFFMKDEATVVLGSAFLRVACIGTIPMVMFFLLNTTFQAMGKGKQSLFLVMLRQAVINLPILFLLNALFGIDGVVWTQLIADTISVGIATVLFGFTMRQLREEERAFGKQVA